MILMMVLISIQLVWLGLTLDCIYDELKKNRRSL